MKIENKECQSELDKCKLISKKYSDNQTNRGSEQSISIQKY